MCCAFCYVRLGQWKQEDIPYEEHKRWSQPCPFKNARIVGNITVASNNEELIRSRDVCGSSTGKQLCLYLFCYMCMSLIFLSLIFNVLFTAIEPSEQKPSGFRDAVFPEYGTVETRMETFKQYPVPVESLPEAGFFICGEYFTIYCVL